MPQPGETLGGRYRLDDRIAAGGMGEVWRATDTVLGRTVAVKTLRTDQAGDPGFQTRFEHEARAMASLHHSGVADVYDFGETGANAFIVMALIDGTALNQLIYERGRLSVAETMSIVAQAGRALNAAHEAGIVHRDVKPGNLIIKPDGTVVLVDFGVARSADSAALTGAKEVVGTALYIAPEQVSKQTTGPAADVYALGAVAYHCLSGHPPFEGDNPIAVAMQHLQDEPPELPADVPPAVRALVKRAMAKNPADRFPSAAAMADAAERVGDAGSTTAILAAGVAGIGGVAGTHGVAGTGGVAGATGAGRATGSFAPGVARAGSTSSFATGTARPAAPGGTAVFQAVEREPYGGPGGPGRSRTPWLMAAVALLLLAGGGVALAAAMGAFDGDNTPTVTTSTPAAPTATQKGGNAPEPTRETPTGHKPTTARTSAKPTDTPSRTPSPTPSAEPSTTSTPSPTATPSPSPTEGDEGEEGGEEGNDGNGQ